MEQKNIEIKCHGLKCDNHDCDWKDETVPFDEHLAGWINKPCPKCGNNLLTLLDFFNAVKAIAAAEHINTLTPEQLKEINNQFSPEEISEMMKNIKGAEHIAGDGLVSVSVETHEEIKVMEIKPIGS